MWNDVDSLAIAEVADPEDATAAPPEDVNAVAVRTVIIVDPEPLMQRGLAATLEYSGRLKVVGQAPDADRALALIDKHRPDLVMTEFVLPGINGLELTRAIRKKYARTRIIAMCSQEEAICAERALRYGAHGLVLRHDDPQEIIDAVDSVLEGNISIARRILNQLLESIAHAVHPLIPSPPDVLSGREMELFEMMGQGLDLKAIAKKMGVTEKTAASYRTRVKEKLNLCSTLELMRRATQWASPDRICYSWPGCADRIFTG